MTTDVSEVAEALGPIKLHIDSYLDRLHANGYAPRSVMVRQFATWLSAFDPQTEVPPRRLIPSRRRRNRPHIFTDADVVKIAGESPDSFSMASALYVLTPRNPWLEFTCMCLSQVTI